MKEHKIGEKIIEAFCKQFDFELSQYFKTRVVAEQLLMNRAYQETKLDLETNPKFKEFFSHYRADSIPEFIDAIATEKQYFIHRGDALPFLQTKRVLDPKIKAEQGLWEIQQKKLFIAQCLWRAEKLEIPEVKVCMEFYYWEQNIKECPFLEPVTEDEIELYKGYILTEDYTLNSNSFSSFQDYGNLKNEYMNSEEGGYMPEWYSYYDIRKGTGSYLILPDIRGNKEKKYLDASNKQEKELREVAVALTPPQPKRLDYYEIMDLVIDFFEVHEAKTTIELMKKTSYNYESKIRRETDDDDDDEYKDRDNGEARHALSELQYTPFKIPNAGYYDWKKGIVNALYKYETQQVADAMRLVFEDYQMRREMGLPFENTEPYEGHIKQWEENLHRFRERILTGRELLGEPRDFDF